MGVTASHEVASILFNPAHRTGQLGGSHYDSGPGGATDGTHRGQLVGRLWLGLILSTIQLRHGGCFRRQRVIVEGRVWGQAECVGGRTGVVAVGTSHCALGKKGKRLT